MKEEEIFHQVLQEKVENRPAFLEAACGADVDLRQRIAVLLNAQENPGSFLQQPVFGAEDLPTLDQPIVDRIGSQIGPYKLLEEIGEGGMGTVYMAEQKKPVRRCVALKIVKAGMDSRQVLARFDAERQALAMMDHPSIARIIDAGTTELGRPYFVMELVRGIPINEFCDQNRLTVRERLELFLKVCQAVQHAHQKGIIHRDLKPTNVLVTKLDVVAVPKVIDFGIAKAFGSQLTDHTQVTGFAQFLGTPQYMSPEQAEMNQLGVDTRSDVYSLGVMLYELLTGDTPFDRDTVKKSNFFELQRILREVEPPSPSSRISTLKAQALSTMSERRGSDPRRMLNILRGELDWIVMKALEKDRERRYESASAFAADVQRYLQDEPVQACPPSRVYQFRKFAKRHRAKFVSSSAVLLALVLGFSLSVWQAIRATKAQIQADIHATDARKNELQALEEQRKANAAEQAERLAREAEIVERLKAEKQAELAEDRLYFADMRLNSMDTESANISRLLENLLDHVPVAGEKDRRRWDWYYLLGLSHENQYDLMDAVGSIQSIAWSPNGNYLAISSIGGSVVIYETDTWKISKKINLSFRTRGLSWSPDSRHVSWGTAGSAGQVSKPPSVASTVTVFNVETEELSRLYGSEASVWATTWSPDGEQLASAGMDLKIRVWNWKSRECEREFPVYGNVWNLYWHPNLPRIVASVTAQDIMSYGLDAVIIDTNQGPIPEAFGIHDATTCRWNTDGSLLAIGKSNGVCSIYDAKRWTVQREWPAHHGKISSIEWSKDSQRVITGGVDSLIHIWNRETGVLSQSLQGSTEIVNSIDLSPDGHQIATGDTTAKIWNFQTKLPHRTIGDKQTKITQIDWRKGSRTIDSITENQIIAWDVDTGLQASITPWKSGQAIGINSRGEQFAVVERGNEHKEVILHDLRTGSRLRSLCEMVGESTRWFYPHCLCFNIDASKIGLAIPLRFKSKRNYHAIAVVGQEDKIAELEPYIKVESLKGLAFSPDTAQIACIGELPISVGFSSHLFVLDVDSGKIAQSIPMSDVQAACLAWSNDGKRIVTGDMNGMACVWDPVNRTKLAATQVHSARVHSVAWHPSDSLIASQGGDRIAIWDPATGEELIWLPCKSDSTGSVKWSPDGKCLAATDSDGRIQLWDASTGYEFAKSNEFKDKLLWFQLDKAIASYKSGRKETAYQILEQALRGKSDYARTLPEWIFNRWSEFVALSTEDRTLADWTLRMFPENRGPRIDSIRIEALVRAGKQEESEKLVRRVLAEKRSGRVREIIRITQSLQKDGFIRESESILEICIEVEKEDSLSYNNVAWLLATSPFESQRDGRLAVELAHKAVQQDPNSAISLNTLGVAYYRTGDWKETIRFLEKSMEQRQGGDSFDWYFLAMAHWQLGQKQEALQWYDKCMSATDGDIPTNEELARFHAEATTLLEIGK